VADFGGIELTSRCRALSNELIRGGRISELVAFAAVAFACAPRYGLGPAEPPHTETQHDSGSNDTKARSGKGSRSEEGHRNGILNCGRAWERRHRECRGSERDGCRHQAPGNVGGAEQLLRHRRQYEKGDEETDAAVGDHRARENHSEYGVACAQTLRHEARDRFHGAAVVHELAEQRAEQEQRKELREKLRGVAHERLCPMGKKRLA
jgi:hypothetical protein